MKKSLKITCCGVISALAAAVMLATNIPIMLYAVPALAGALFIIPAIEINTKWALVCYAVTSALSVILPTEREALVVFIGILGYYPVLKMVIEKRASRAIGYFIKLAVFNAAMIASYAVIIKILGIRAFESGKFGLLVTELLFLAVGNVVFVLYDIALTRVIRLYFFRLRKTVRRILGLGGKY